MQDVITCARAITSEALAPIFLTSAVTGQGLELLRLFINLSSQRHPWAARQAEPVEFIIDETFGVPGVGTVIAGTVKRGVLTAQTPVLLGPDIGDGSFWRVAIKSIHYKRLPVSEAVAGQTAALALKKVRTAHLFSMFLHLLRRAGVVQRGARFAGEARPRAQGHGARAREPQACSVVGV